MNKNKKASYLQIFRIVVQLIFFVLLPGLYANAFQGIKLLWQGIFDHDFSLVESLPMLISTITIIPLTLFLGRFFCGWMCSFGTMGDMLFYLSRKVFKIKFRISEKVDHILKYVKYVVLIAIFLVIWSIQALDISSLSPWDAFGSLFIFTKLPDFSYVITNVTVGFVLLLVIMIGSFFVERFFCRYLCPLGAVFTLISQIKFIKLRKPSKDCGRCRACTQKCSMGIPLYQEDTVNSGECIDCMKCIPVCPRENIHVTVATAVTNPALAGALAVTAMTGVYYIGTYAVNGSLTATGVSQVAAAENSSIYADGSFEGSGTGFRGATTTVSVTVKGGIITDINALSYGDDSEYFDVAFPSIVNHIISTQSADVDAVSGATFSSNGIMEAVSNALKSSRQALDGSSSEIVSSDDTTGEVTPFTNEDTEIAGESTNDATIAPTKDPTTAPTEALTKAPSSSKTSSNNDSTSDKDKASTTKSTKKSSSSTTKSSTKQSSDSKSTTNSTTSGTGSKDTKSDSSPTQSAADSDKTATSSKYKDGTYEGSANGFRRGVTTVSVTVKDDEITDIQIVSHGDTPRFFDRTYSTVISEILDSQSAEVDAVSGATYSSLGIMNAVADALSNAQ